MKRIKQVVTVVLLASFMLLSAGCYGSFNLTKKVYNWNGKVGDKWGNELVFLVLSIIPVYEVSAAVDAIILNSIEFWTGHNPLASNVITKDGTTVAFNADKKEITVNYENKSVTLTQENGKTVAKDDRGNVIAYAATNNDGTLNIMDAQGKILHTYSKDQVESISMAQ